MLNEKFILDLSHENNLHKIKMLSLVDSVDTAHELSFDDVKTRLGINENEIEEFVIDAMQRKLIRGRIDQINRKVIVRLDIADSLSFQLKKSMLACKV